MAQQNPHRIEEAAACARARSVHAEMLARESGKKGGKGKTTYNGESRGKIPIALKELLRLPFAILRHNYLWQCYTYNGMVYPPNYQPLI